MINLIVTVAANGVIGDDSRLPWMIPSIIQDTLETVEGHEVLVGRKTFEFMESKNFPLAAKTYVLSRRVRTPRIKNVSFISSINKVPLKGKKEIFIVGGFETFKSLLPYVNGKIIAYKLDKDYEGDTRLDLSKYTPTFQMSEEGTDLLTMKEVGYKVCWTRF
jgi:dihydrofolate reductase